MPRERNHTYEKNRVTQTRAPSSLASHLVRHASLYGSGIHLFRLGRRSQSLSLDFGSRLVRLIGDAFQSGVFVDETDVVSVLRRHPVSLRSGPTFDDSFLGWAQDDLFTADTSVEIESFADGWPHIPAIIQCRDGARFHVTKRRLEELYAKHFPPFI